MAARVLVCSPSNSSVDKYVTALQELLGPEQMLRVQAPHRGTVLGAVHARTAAAAATAVAAGSEIGRAHV